MKALKNSFFVLTVVFIYSCGSNPDTKVPALSVSTTIIKVDGIFDETAWSEAIVHHISDSIDLLLFQNEDHLFIGIKSLSEFQRTSTDLYLKSESVSPINLHASMQLGERQFEKQSWNPQNNPYNWGNNKDWTANIFQWNEELRESRSLKIIEKLLFSEGQEFVISKNKLPSNSFDLSVKINAIGPDNQASPISYPEKSNEEDPSTWLNFTLASE